jgi:small subunit ribosomal protein S8
MVNDPVADFLIRVKNANKAGKEAVSMAHSALKEAIADLLVREGYLKSASAKKQGPHKSLEIELAYNAEGEPRIAGALRVSRLGKRVYRSAALIRPYKNGFGRTVISTSKGVMTDKDVSKAKIGGEVLFNIW